jgi:multidrug transporter EmrE-like cation transporter
MTKTGPVPWICVAVTILVTIYGQLVVKWQIMQRGHPPPGLFDKVSFFAAFFTNPWMISVGISIGIGALTWVTALSRLELSKAYPFTALSFISVLLLSAVFFGESITIAKVAGVALVITGLIVGASL